MARFFDRLEAARRDRDTVLCVGLDPRVERIPAEVTVQAGDDLEALLTRFTLGVLDAVEEHAACVKPQIGFFEMHGLAGLRAYATVVAEARRRGIPVIGDVKRGDIGFTAQAYAKAHLRPGGDFEVDAITVNPYQGTDALQPFADAAVEEGKGIYVLVRTSNEGARELQEVRVADGDDRVFERVADLVAALGLASRSPETGLSSIGAVVGATAPEAQAALRARLPDTPFLVPGYGAQGATAADVAQGFRSDGSGAVVNASRSVIHPADTEGGWQSAVAAAARRAREELHDAIVRS